jgi:hypothetical protein
MKEKRDNKIITVKFKLKIDLIIYLQVDTYLPTLDTYS